MPGPTRRCNHNEHPTTITLRQVLVATVSSPRQKLINIFSRYGFFTSADTALQEKILTNSRLVALNAFHYFFEQGSRPEQLALIGSGSIRVFVINHCGREVTLYHVRAGEACPLNMLSILTGQTTPAAAMAECGVLAAVMNANYYRKLISLHHPAQQFVFDTFASQLNHVFSLFSDLKFKKLETRLAEYLEQSFPPCTPPSAEEPLSITVTHQHLAAELGSAREVISRLLGKFERAGIVELRRGKIRITDKQALRDIAVK